MLRASPAIADAVVSAVPDAAGGIRLVAHLVARADPPPAPRELRAFLATRLPAHMVPSAYAYLQALPATVNGKVDRAALPPPPAERAEASELYAAPRTRIEEKLADTWRELLGLDRIGIDDNFFEPRRPLCPRHRAAPAATRLGDRDGRARHFRIAHHQDPGQPDHSRVGRRPAPRRGAGSRETAPGRPERPG